MASVVSIRVTVDDANATQTLGKIETALNSVGVQGSASIRQLGSQVDELGGHLARPLDAVRLLSQEFGFRLPRALEMMISRMPGVVNGLMGVIGALAGIAAAEVFVRLGEEIYDAEQKYLSINAVAEKFYETMKKASEIDFSNTRSIETTGMRDAIAYARSQQQLQSGDQDSSSGWKLIAGGVVTGANPYLIGAGIRKLYIAHGEAEEGYKSKQQGIDLQGRDSDQYHQQMMADIEAAHAKDALLDKDKQITAEKQKQHDIDAENRRFNTEREKSLGNPVPTNAGANEQTRKDAVADAEAHVKLVQLGLEQQLAIMRAQNEAREAGLQGEALYAQKRRDAIAQLQIELASEHELAELPARRAALEQQVDNERLKRMHELQEETARGHDTSTSAGLTGSQRILAEGRATQNEIDAKEAKYSGGATLKPEEFAAFNQQRLDAANATTQKLKELEDQFTEHAKAVAQERTDAQLGEFGRVDAEAERTRAALKKSYDEDVAGLKDDDQLKIAATAAYNAAVLAINADAEQKKKELRDRNREEDDQYDRQALQSEARIHSQSATGWIGQHRAAIEAIRAQEQERLQKIQDDAQKEGLTYEEVQKRRLDVTRETEAEIQEQQQQAAHTLASTLESVWDNPMKALKEKAQHAMFEIIANWMMQTQLFKTFFGSAVGSMQPGSASTGSGTGIPSVMHGGATAGIPGVGGILGRILGLPAGMNAPGTGGVISHGATLPADYNDGSGSGVPVLHRRDTSADIPDGGDGGTYSDAGGGDFSGGGLVGSGVGNMARYFTSGTNGGGDLPGFGDLGNLAKYFPSSRSGTVGSGGVSIPGVGGTSAPAMSSVAGVGGMANVALAGYAGAEGVIDSFHQGGAGGALHGAMSGASLGASIGSLVPGLGTAAGAIVGAAAGLTTNLIGDAIGMSGRFAARDYYKKSIEPELDAMKNKPGGDGGDYMSQMDEVNSISAQGMNTMAAKFGMAAANWVNQNYMQKEVLLIDGSISMRAQGGSAYTGMAAKQFHDGGTIDGFGSLGTSSTEGFIHALRGEGIVTRPAMAEHGAGVGMMNRGASAADMAAHYLATSGGSSRTGSGGSGGGHTFHINTLDPKTMQHWLRNGGAKMILGGINDHAANYSGDGQV